MEKMSHRSEKKRKMSQHMAKSAEARPAQNSFAALPPFELPPLLALGELGSTSSAAARAFRHPGGPYQWVLRVIRFFNSSQSHLAVRN